MGRRKYNEVRDGKSRIQKKKKTKNLNDPGWKAKQNSINEN